MCGRFALATEKNILEMLYQLEIRSDFDLQPRFNIVPSQQIVAFRRSPQSGEKELVNLKWGLVPFWSEDEASGSRLINALVAALHNRMPVIIPRQAYKYWLDPGTESASLKELLIPYPSAELIFHPVSRLVNSPTNDSSDMVEPLQKIE